MKTMKAIKKTVSILIVAAMILGIFTMIPFTASATEGERVYENFTVYQWYPATRPATIVENNERISDPSYIAIDRNNLYDNLIIVRANANVSFSWWANTWDYVLSQTEDLTVTPYNSGDNDTLHLENTYSKDGKAMMDGKWYNYDNVPDDLAYSYVYVHAEGADQDNNRFLTYDDNGTEEECRWGYYTWRENLTLTYHPYTAPTCQSDGNQEYYSDQYGNCYNPALHIDTENHTLRANKFSEDDTIIGSGGNEHQFDDPTFTWTATDFDTDPTVEISQSICAVCGTSSDWQIDDIVCYDQIDPDENTCGQKKWNAEAYEQNSGNYAESEYLVCCGATGHTYSTEPQWSSNNYTVTFACTDGGNDAQFDSIWMEDYAVPATAESCACSVSKYAIFFNGAEYTHEVKNVSSVKAKAKIRRWKNNIFYSDYYFASLRDAFDAAKDGDTVKLLNNSTLQSDYTLDNKYVTLDLNGKKVNAEGSSKLLIGENESAEPTLTIVDNSYLKNGSFTAPLFMSNGTLTLESGSIGSIIGTYGTVVIDGGTVDGSIAMTHDQFREVQINGGKFCTLPTADYVTYSGVISEYSDDYYTVSDASTVALITGDGQCNLPFATLALAADTVRSGETISVVADIGDSGLVKFDGVDNVTLNATGFTVNGFSIGLYDADVTITGGTFVGYSGNEMIWGVKNKTPDENTKSTLTIKGGEFSSESSTGFTITGNTAYTKYITVNIEGGSFESTNESATSAIHVNSNNAETNNFVVSGGRFKPGFDEAYLAENCVFDAEDENGFRSVVSALDIEKGYSIALNEDIVIRYYLNDIPEGADLNDYSITYTYKGTTTTENPTNHAVNPFVIANCYAQDINKPVAVTVKYKDTVINEGEYSVYGYCTATIDDPDAAGKDKNICKSVINYGSSAIEYFENGERLDRADYNIDENIPNQYKYNSSGEEITAKVSFTLVTNSSTEMNFYIKPSSPEDLDQIAAHVFVDYNDTGIEPEILTTSNRLRLKISGIKPVDLDKVYTLKVTDQGQTRQFECSPLSYAYMYQNAEDTKLSNMMRQLYGYYKAAEEYFSNNETE